MAGVAFWACPSCLTGVFVETNRCPQCGGRMEHHTDAPGVRNKYGAVRTVRDGFAYDSKAEADRGSELLLMLRSGIIADVKHHEAFEIRVNGHHICLYEADFTVTHNDGSRVVEDVKGVRTSVYRLKKKLMLAVHGIEIVEVGKCRKPKPRRRAGAKPRA